MLFVYEIDTGNWKNVKTWTYEYICKLIKSSVGHYYNITFSVYISLWFWRRRRRFKANSLSAVLTPKMSTNRRYVVLIRELLSLRIQPTLGVCQNLHSSTKHCPQHAVLFRQSSDRCIVQRPSNIQFHVFCWRPSHGHRMSCLSRHFSPLSVFFTGFSLRCDGVWTKLFACLRLNTRLWQLPKITLSRPF